MTIEVYNFIWTMSQSLPCDVPVQHQQPNVVEARIRPTRGVILFPALLTPLLYVEGRKPATVELLVATEDVLTAEMVNHQLKVSKGLQPWKPYRVRTLFGGVSRTLAPDATAKIVVAEAGSLDARELTILSTHERFAGVLQRDFVRALEGAKCTRLYRIQITDPAGCFAAACDKKPCPTPEVISRSNNGPEGLDGTKYCCFALPPNAGDEDLRSPPLRDPEDRDITGLELHDRLIAAMTERRFVRGLPPGGGYHCFPVEEHDVDPSHFHGKAPVQSYHPVYRFTGKDDAFTYADFGHLSDVHVNTRWRIVGRNPARVIENDAAHSPPVGQLLSDNNRSFVGVLSQLVAAKSHFIAVGGDLIDHIRNAHWASANDAPSVREVWDAVNMDSDTGGYTPQTYPPGVDLVGFYSIILRRACRFKPVFVLTGNHDCYYEAFGISPRIKIKGRANEGIPADLNLTMYEALLAFGPSSGVLAGPSSPFEPEWFEWFYTVLTPFRDYWQKLPKQSLVACAWGYGEDIITDLPGAQGLGHLGRSDDAITETQLALIRAAVAQKSTHKVILLTHFTVASFRDNVPMLAPDGSRTIGTLSGGARRNEFDWGTFEERHAGLNRMLHAEDIQLVVTGHTHRRGVYRITGQNGNDLTVDLEVAPATGLEHDPERERLGLVVSDSAGPYPRSNRQGEFLGWGSDLPGGSMIWTDKESGLVKKVQPIQAQRAKPRAAVAADYVDLQEGKAFALQDVGFLESVGALLSPSGLPTDACMMVAVAVGTIEGRRAARQFVYMPLGSHLRGMGVQVGELVLASASASKKVLIPTVVKDGAKVFGFEVDERHQADLRNWLNFEVPGSRFLSLRLELAPEPTKLTPAQQRLFREQRDHLENQYDWADRWHFEVAVQLHQQDAFNDTLPLLEASLAPVKWYSVRRTKRSIKVLGPGWFGTASYPDVPDWLWREESFPRPYQR